MATVTENGTFQVDLRYEFEAPQHYDFSEPSMGVCNSSWFDGRAGEPSPLREVNTNDAEHRIAPHTSTKEKPARKNNIVTSWGAEVKKRKTPDNPGGGLLAEQATRKVKHASTAYPSTGPVTRSVSRQRDASRGQAGDGAARRENRAATAAVGAAGRSDNRQERQAKATAKSAATQDAVNPVAAAGVAAKSVAATRRLSRGIPVGKKAGSAKDRLLKTLMPKKTMPTRSTKQLTIPEEPTLRTSTRAGRCTTHVAPNSKQAQDHDEEKSPFKPLALKVKEFDKTPGRFKRKPLPPPPASRPVSLTKPQEPVLWTSTRSRAPLVKSHEQQEEEEMAGMPQFRASTLNPLVLSSSGQIGVPRVEKRGVTEPQPFQFISDDRAEARARRAIEQQVVRPLAEAADAEQANAEEAQVQQQQQQRGPITRARKSELPQPMLMPAGPTIPISPHLRTKTRARESRASDLDGPPEFKSRPLPKFLPMPGSGELALNRSTAGTQGPPAPTQPQPFNLRSDARGALHQAQLTAKVAEEEARAREARQPKAQPLPLSTDLPLVPPRPEARPLTLPQPFTLRSQARHEEYVAELSRELAEEEEAKRKEAEFKARPVWRGVPFAPPPGSDLPLTLPVEPNLHTGSRAAERERFDAAVEAKIKAAEEEKRRQEEEKKREEEREVRRYRKSLAFHARPMPDYNAIPAHAASGAGSSCVQQAERKLTVPVSPKLGRKRNRGDAE